LLKTISNGVRSILGIYIKFNNSQRKARRVARRWAERAASMRRAAHLRPLGAAQEGLFLVTCFQFNAATPKQYDSAC
jgi:hypothetical protein